MLVAECNIRGDSADENCLNEGCESTGSNSPGLWDFGLIIGQSLDKSRSRAIDALE
ncbi:hypothetical protein PAMP_003769 [Pampus punctatissimus]